MGMKLLASGIAALLLALLPTRASIPSPSPIVSSTPPPSPSTPTPLATSLEEIRRQIPPGWALRLPSHETLDPLVSHSSPSVDIYTTRVFAFDNSSGLIASIFRCNSGDVACLVLSIAVEAPASSAAQQTFQHYQSHGRRVELSGNLRGYWLESQEAAMSSSLVWQQDGFLYNVTVAGGAERSLDVARSMVIAPMVSNPVAIAPSPPSRQFPPPSSPTMSPTLLAPYLEEIRRSVPADWALRLPTHLPGPFAATDQDPYTVRVFTFDTPPGIAVSFFRCESGEPACLVSSLAIDSASSSPASQAMSEHQQMGRPFPLSDQVNAYLIGRRQSSGTESSLMWQHDGLIYTVVGTAQNSYPLLELAQAIAQSPPVAADSPVITQSPPSASDREPAPSLSHAPRRESDAPFQASSTTPSSAVPTPQTTVPSAIPSSNSTSSSTVTLAPSPNIPLSPTASSPSPASEGSLTLPTHFLLPHRRQTDASAVLFEDDLGQVTSVAQLSDVEPTDWAYSALQSLVERYGVITGFPDQTYRGDRALTRYEFASGLNTVLDRIEQLIQDGLAARINQDDLATVQRLQTEFEGELLALGGTIDTLEARTEVLESQQFSPTVQLAGEAIFGAVFPGGGDPPGLGNNNPFLAYQTQLNVFGGFSGRPDFFRIGLTAANFDNLGAAGPSALNTNMALLSFQSDTQSDTNNSIDLSALEYRFAAFDERVVFTVKPVGFSLGSVLSSNSPISSAGQEAISRFAEESPLFKIGSLESGIGADWLITNRLRLQAAYGSRNASIPNRQDSDIDDDHNALGVQLLFTPTDNIISGIAYINGFAEDGRLDTGTGSFNADISGGFNEFTRIHGINGTLQWQLGDNVILSAWGGLTYAESMESSASAGTTTYAASLSLLDIFGREGDLLGLFFGQPPKLIGGDRITPDDATSRHFELFYRFRLNDHISITPGFFYVTDPGHIEANDDIIVGTVRTTFRF